MKSNFIYSHSNKSAGAIALSKALGWPLIRHEGSRYRGSRNKTVLNWGSSQLPIAAHVGTIINQPALVSRVANKLRTYYHLEGRPYIPWWCEDHAEAADWLEENEGESIVARTILNGSGGAGIVISDDANLLPVGAPLYVEYVPKKEEYRIHVFVGGPEADIIFVQQKKRKLDAPEPVLDRRIRNHRNGYIYARDGVVVPDAVVEAARDAVHLLGLHFGAADVGWNIRHQRATLYEVNTAPGLEGSTLRDYVEAMRMWVND